MARIPTYKKQPLENIRPEDILLGEKIEGTNQTSTYDFQTLEQYFQGGGGGGSSLENDVQASLTVGGITQGEIVPKYTTFTQFVELLIAPNVDPTMSINYVTCSGVSSGTKEVGEIYATTLVSTYNQGLIHSANGAGDVPLTGGKTTHLFSGSGVDGNTGVVSATIMQGSNFWGVTQNYFEGTDPYYSSDSQESHIFDAFRIAGGVFDNSNTITGKYKYWWSVGTAPTDSAGVRLLHNYGFFPVSTFNISIAQGETIVAFYLPDTAGTVTVLYVESSYADVTGDFTVSPMIVNDAGGTSVGYNRYEQVIGGTGYAADANYQININ